MRELKGLLCWIFAITFLICARIAFFDILRAIHWQHGFLSNSRLVLIPAMFTILAVVLGMACFTIWRGKPSANRWGIAASLTYLLPTVVAIIYSSHSLLRHTAVTLALGAVGLFAFLRHDEQPESEAKSEEHSATPGDGTISSINKFAELLIGAGGLAASFWWAGWLRSRGVAGYHSGWSDIALFVLVVLVIAAIHELAHTTTGLALGMKLRAFVVGPFQWRIREGKWQFQFNLEGLLAGGATGVVPATADFPRWRYLCMVAAGPLVTLLSGVLALGIALTNPGSTPAQTSGLFGIWSLAVGAGNLLPFRIRNNYSDGAILYQLISDGPWAEYHQVLSTVGSSLVTPLRPKDFDIEAIRRSTRNIAQGERGLLLRLFAFMYFFDCDKVFEAGEALKEAEAVYLQCAADIPPELHSVFVFANAYVRRDAGAAREWWTRMQAKKPTRFNVDYWMADSALHWIEVNLKEANESWEKSNALAQLLPKAGAYEYDRYCCSKLRQALDEAAAA